MSCPICYEPLGDEETIHCNICKAVIHKECYNLTNGCRCPLCRQFIITDTTKQTILNMLRNDSGVLVDNVFCDFYEIRTFIGFITHNIMPANEMTVRSDLDIEPGTLTSGILNLYNDTAITEGDGFSNDYEQSIATIVRKAMQHREALIKPSFGLRKTYIEEFKKSCDKGMIFGVRTRHGIPKRAPIDLLAKVLTGKELVPNTVPIVDAKFEDIWDGKYPERKEMLREFMKINLRNTIDVYRKPFDTVNVNDTADYCYLCKSNGCVEEFEDGKLFCHSCKRAFSKHYVRPHIKDRLHIYQEAPPFELIKDESMETLASQILNYPSKLTRQILEYKGFDEKFVKLMENLNEDAIELNERLIDYYLTIPYEKLRPLNDEAKCEHLYANKLLKNYALGRIESVLRGDTIEHFKDIFDIAELLALL